MTPTARHPPEANPIAAMQAAWRINARASATARNGIATVHWDHRSGDDTELNCGLGDDHMIFSLHLSGFSFASVTLDGRRRCAEALPRGSWMLVDTGGRPSAETSGPFSLLHVYVPKALMRQTCEAYELPCRLPDSPVYRTGTLADGEITRAARALGAAAMEPGLLAGMQLDQASQNLLVDLISLLHANGMERHRHLSTAARRSVESYIDRHLDSPITLDDLAHAAGLSKYHFLRAFKADFGQTPMSALRDRRLKAAARLLASSSAPIIEIALACGFADHSHFSTAFRVKFGQSPTAFRSANLA